MPSSEQPQISAGQPLDVQPGVSNIGENQAELDALRNANIDGQDIFPQSVSTRRFSAEDGAFSGNIYAGSMLIGAGGMTITSDPDLGTPNTGLYLDSSVLYLIKDGVATVTLNGTTGTATFTGAIYATSGTFTGDISASTISSMSSVDFGTNVTIGGDLFLNGADFSGKVVFDGATQAAYINWDETIEYLDIRNNRSFGGIGISTAGGTILSLSDELKRIYLAATESLGVDADIDLVIGDTAGSTFKVARGIGTTVMSFVGNSNTVTFAGNIIVGAGADYVLTGPDATAARTVRHKLLGVSVTGTGNFATAAWTHGWDTSTQFVTFSATMHGINTAASTGISNVRVTREAGDATVKVQFNVATYVSTQTINFDVMAMGPA
jgi:hypothetical protein